MSGMIPLDAGSSGDLFWGSLGEPFCSPSEHDSSATISISSMGYFLEGIFFWGIIFLLVFLAIGDFCALKTPFSHSSSSLDNILQKEGGFPSNLNSSTRMLINLLPKLVVQATMKMSS
jgi:hypothetical protein